MAFMVLPCYNFCETFPKMKRAPARPIMLMELEIPEQCGGQHFVPPRHRDVHRQHDEIIAEVPLAEDVRLLDGPAFR